jgi:hypothetical protein
LAKSRRPLLSSRKRRLLAGGNDDPLFLRASSQAARKLARRVGMITFSKSYLPGPPGRLLFRIVFIPGRRDNYFFKKLSSRASGTITFPDSFHPEASGRLLFQKVIFPDLRDNYFPGKFPSRGSGTITFSKNSLPEASGGYFLQTLGAGEPGRVPSSSRWPPAVLDVVRLGIAAPSLDGFFPSGATSRRGAYILRNGGLP